MIHIYYAPTGNSMRAVLAMEECGLEYRRHLLDLTKNEHKAPEFLELNRMGQVPVIIDENGPDGKKMVLTQSGIILLYAAEKSGKLILADPIKRFEALQWTMANLMDAHAYMGILNYTEKLEGAQSEMINQNIDAKQRNYLKVIQEKIGGKPFVLDELSIADVSLFPLVRRRISIFQKDPELKPLVKWHDKFSERPTVIKAYA